MVLKIAFDMDVKSEQKEKNTKKTIPLFSWTMGMW